MILTLVSTKPFYCDCLEINGIDLVNPKPVMKSWLENSYCSYEDYEQLVDLINRRNKLSQLYNKEEYLKIHGALKEAYRTMASQLRILEK